MNTKTLRFRYFYTYSNKIYYYIINK